MLQGPYFAFAERAADEADANLRALKRLLPDEIESGESAGIWQGDDWAIRIALAAGSMRLTTADLTNLNFSTRRYRLCYRLGRASGWLSVGSTNGTRHYCMPAALEEIGPVNLVSFALRRPMTVLVLVFATVLVGLLSIQRMPRDIFPDLGVPVLYVAQPYGGMDRPRWKDFWSTTTSTIFSTSTASNMWNPSRSRARR
jgi:hypothetical protein